MFFDHPRPGKIQGACFRVFPLNPILLGRGIFAFRNFRFWQTSCSGEQRVTLTTRSISTASLWRTTRVGRASQQGTPCPISAEFLGTNTTEELFSWFLVTYSSCSRAAAAQHAHGRCMSCPSSISCVTSQDESTHRRREGARQRNDDVFRTTGNQSVWSHRACLTLQVEGLNLIWSQSKKKQVNYCWFW